MHSARRTPPCGGLRLPRAVDLKVGRLPAGPWWCNCLLLLSLLDQRLNSLRFLSKFLQSDNHSYLRLVWLRCGWRDAIFARKSRTRVAAVRSAQLSRAQPGKCTTRTDGPLRSVKTGLTVAAAAGSCCALSSLRPRPCRCAHYGPLNGRIGRSARRGAAVQFVGCEPLRPARLTPSLGACGNACLCCGFWRTVMRGGCGLRCGTRRRRAG